VTQLFKYERIETTVTRAKEVRMFAERSITNAKRVSETDSERFWKRLRGFIFEPDIIQKAVTVLAERYRHRPGGYTRILRTRIRPGDAAPMAFIELVDRHSELRPARPVGENHVKNQIKEKRARSQTQMQVYDETRRAWEASRPLVPMEPIVPIPVPRNNILPPDKEMAREQARWPLRDDVFNVHRALRRGVPLRTLSFGDSYQVHQSVQKSSAQQQHSAKGEQKSSSAVAVAPEQPNIAAFERLYEARYRTPIDLGVRYSRYHRRWVRQHDMAKKASSSKGGDPGRGGPRSRYPPTLRRRSALSVATTATGEPAAAAAETTSKMPAAQTVGATKVRSEAERAASLPTLLD